MGDVMYSKNNILLPSKSVYTLKEACEELNLYFNRTDINIAYLLDLINQGYIWVHAKFSKHDYLLAWPMDWELEERFDTQEEQVIAEIMFFNKMLSFQRNYNNWGDYDLYLKLSISSAFDFLNNKKSTKPRVIDIYDPCEHFYLFESYLKSDCGYDIELHKIPEEFSRDDYFSKVLINHSAKICIKTLSYFDVYDEVFRGTELANSYYEIPEIFEIQKIHNEYAKGKIEVFKWKREWTEYYWYSDKKLERLDLEFFLDDLIILKEDMDCLKKGESRKIRERKEYISPIVKRNFNKLEIQPEHTTSKNSISNKSINKIIYALANLANLDLSQPQAAFAQLQLYCEKNNFELPNKDTCGKAFKDAHYHFNNFSSK